MTVANPEFTVQWRRAASDEIIGQYPDPAQSVAEAQELDWIG